MTGLLLVLALATPKQIDVAGQKAFVAVRAYERVMLEHSRARDAWPTLERRSQIAVKLAIAHETILDSLALGADLQPGQGISAQALSLLRAQQGAIVALAALTADGPPDAKQAMTHVIQRFNALFGLFPTVPRDDDHPPPRPKT